VSAIAEAWRVEDGSTAAWSRNGYSVPLTTWFALNSVTDPLAVMGASSGEPPGRSAMGPKSGREEPRVSARRDGNFPPQSERYWSGRRRSDVIPAPSSKCGVQPSAVRPTARAAWSHAHVRSAEHGERG